MENKSKTNATYCQWHSSGWENLYLKEFGATHYNQTVYINLETNLLANSYFDTDITPLRIVQFLETISNTRIIADETLIILDEIQACPRALTSLKTF